MRSTFHGLETMKRAIYAQQYGIYTTGHNIANANTEGYTRQRVNMGTMTPLDPIGVNRSATAGQLGTGVIVRDVVRLRAAFLDSQFRHEHQRVGDWEVRLDTLEKLEAIVNEPSENGLGAALDEFWTAWDELAANPGEHTTRTLVIQKMQALVEAFNAKGRQLSDLKRDLEENLDIKFNEANELLKHIRDLNEQINKVEASGDNANDLRDRRDLAVDQLSRLLDIRVEVSGEKGNETYKIVLANVESDPSDSFDGVLLDGTTAKSLLDSQFKQTLENHIKGGEINGILVSIDTVTRYQNELNALVNTLVQGKVAVTLPAGTVLASDIIAEDGTILYQKDTVLDEPLTITVNGLNGLHQLGWDGQEPPQTGGLLFETADDSEAFTAENIRVSSELLIDESLLAPSNKVIVHEDGSYTALPESNGIALIIAKFKDEGQFEFDDGNGNATVAKGTIGGYYSAYAAKLGVETDSAGKQLSNNMSVLNHVEMRRASVSAVSLDEEMANLIMFQHAYNAAARNITAIDEMLDRIINGMGHVGR